MDHPTNATAELIAEIDAFLANVGMTQTSFGRNFSNDPALMTRLRGGGSVTLRTADKIRAYIAAHAPKQTAPSQAAAQ